MASVIQTDFLILGAGPAGTSLALMLLQRAPELKVCLLDPSTGYGEKPGETLPPQIKDLMGPLGILEAFQREEHLTANGTSACWGSEIVVESDYLYRTSAPGWRIDKQRFNCFLVEEAKKRGATLKLGVNAKYLGKRNSQFRFQLQQENDPATFIEAAFVVDASGRKAGFATRMGAQKVRYDRLASIWRNFRLKEPCSDTSTLVESSEYGWWYSTLLPGDKLVVAFMTDSDLMPEYKRIEPAWNDWLDVAPYTKKRLDHSVAVGDLEILPAASQRLDTLFGEDWIAVGDAAATFDPLSSQGVFKAMKSGIIGAYAALDYLNGKQGALEKYGRIVQSEFEQYLEIREQFYQQEQRWPESAFWKRRRHQITLDPVSVLYATKESIGKNSNARQLLSWKEVDAILSICNTPCLAKDVVAAFRQNYFGYKKDRNIILGLQFLLEENLLKKVS